MVLLNTNKLWLILILALAIVSGTSPGAASDEVYATDPNDSWNRIFRALFTRTDYDFATPIAEVKAPILVPLRTRCVQCHNSSLTTLMTYSVHDIPPVPTVRILKSSDQEHAFYVARLKEAREDFKSLFSVR